MMELVIIYATGFIYSIQLFAIVCTAFTFWRWGKCVSAYIEDGYIDSDAMSWFFADNNWVHSGARHFGNHPGVVLADFFFILGACLVLAVTWPVSVIVTTVIAYAKIRRAQVVRKETFVAKLDGTHVDNSH